MFNLELAIAAWKRGFEHTPAFQGDDLEELEGHLRDQVEHLMEEGFSPRDAFEAALQDLGDYGTTETEYNKVVREKLNRQQSYSERIIGSYAMFKNYLKIALRNLRRHKGYTLINISGLAAGMACCLLMLRFVQHELGYDRHHERADRIYRITVTQESGGSGQTSATTPVPLAERLAEEYPDLEQVVRFGHGWNGVMQYADRQFHEDRIYFADPAVLNVFDFDFVRGDPATALAAPNSVVITETAAAKYFGDTNPIGQSVEYTYEGSLSLEVTGVVRDQPATSHFHFDFLLPMQSQPRFLEMARPYWEFNVWPTYILLSDPTSATSFEQQLPDFVQRHVPELWRDRLSFHLQPLTDIHLYSQLEGELEANGNITYLYLFSAIALMILLIACINFMNLATARSAHRAREVGIRKVLGAYRSNLMRQFVGEAVLLSAGAVVMALVLAWILLPIFNDLVGRTLRFTDAGGGVLLLGLVGIGLLAGLVSGSYPAFYLSAFQPVQVLKGTSVGSRRATRLRHILVVGQFVISIFFLITIGVMMDQLDYIRNKALGYDQEQLVYIRSPQRTERMNIDLYKTTLFEVPGIRQVTGVSSPPGGGTFDGFPTFAEGMAPDDRVTMTPIFTEQAFVDTYQLNLLQGRDFSDAFGTDTLEALLINEAAVQAAGWQDDVLGRRIVMYRDGGEAIVEGRVVGVLQDFHFESLHRPIQPLVMIKRSVHTWTYLVLRINPANIQQTLTGINQAWTTLAPEWPLDLSFMDESIGNFYAEEERLGRIMGYCTLLALLIACLGVFGLASFTAEQRTKEIGIRKVMGASVTSVILLISKDFTRLVGVAFIVAVPFAYLVAQRWLEQFAYRIEISGWIFLGAGLAALLFAFVAVGYQSMKAALTNPVDALRYE